MRQRPVGIAGSSSRSRDHATEHTRGASLLPPAASEPRDWSDLGRRVLAEALRRVRDELARRGVAQPASVVPRSSPETRS